MAGNTTPRTLLEVLFDGVRAINNLAVQIGKVFPQGSALSTTATAGSNGAPPAQVAKYMTIQGTDGVSYKIPLYLP
ncbi:MAG: hypothetical protein KGL26_11800 [Pseudomonadota bacterium]|nr:hypothetical protein [Pseudomonadota bacterium]